MHLNDAISNLLDVTELKIEIYSTGRAAKQK